MPLHHHADARRRRLRRTTVAAVVAGVGLVLGAVLTNGADSVPVTDRRGDAPPTEAATDGERVVAEDGERGELIARSAPRTPPARVCGSRSLAGPRTKPAGSVRVTPGRRLDLLVDNARRGTTFWLTTGTHVLGRGEYDQVQPKDGMRFIGAPGAVLDGRRLNRYAFTGHAVGVVVEHLTIQRFGTSIADNPHEGVVNHDAGNRWVIRHNTIRRNGGAGVFLGDGTVVAHNCLAANGQYGFSAYEPDGVRNVVLRRNEIAGNNVAGWEHRQPGCGCTGGGKFWETRNARVVGNWVHGNRGAGVWADTNNVGFLVAGNYFARNGYVGLAYETSYNALIRRNTFVRNALVDGPRDPGFPYAALYVSEAGGDRRVDSAHDGRLVIAGNRFVDNWGGVVAWENADRFAGSPANTSTGVGTLVNPGVATVEDCSDPDLIGTDPYYDDCRWKTRQVRVHHNLFEFTASHLPNGCRAADGCGFNGLFSNWGTYPDWSPYQGEAVMDAITFDQGNLWRDNRYVGPWRFMVHGQGNVVSWDDWRAAPYRQDAGSTRD